MKNINIDFEKKELKIDEEKCVSLHSTEGFDVIKQLWEYTNWSNKYSYNFTWLGRPIIQLPDDMLRMQEIIFKVKPTLIIETGVAHGGSLIFYASLLKLISGGGHIIGIDIDIRSHNRQAIEEHTLSPMISLIEGSSIDADVVRSAQSFIKPEDVVLVILDSCHTKEHVLEELKAYAPLVSKNSYIVVADGIMKHLAGAPRTGSDWEWNNPQNAIKDFLAENQDFTQDNWQPLFKESDLHSHPTYYHGGFLRKNRQ